MYKSGWKTTEFWITACSVIGAVMMTLQDVLSPDQAAIASAVASGFYAVSRGLAKGGGG